MSLFLTKTKTSTDFTHIGLAIADEKYTASGLATQHINDIASVEWSTAVKLAPEYATRENRREEILNIFDIRDVFVKPDEIPSDRPGLFITFSIVIPREGSDKQTLVISSAWAENANDAENIALEHDARQAYLVKPGIITKTIVKSVKTLGSYTHICKHSGP